MTDPKANNGLERVGAVRPGVDLRHDFVHRDKFEWRGEDLDALGSVPKALKQ